MQETQYSAIQDTVTLPWICKGALFNRYGCGSLFSYCMCVWYPRTDRTRQTRCWEKGPSSWQQSIFAALNARLQSFLWWQSLTLPSRQKQGVGVWSPSMIIKHLVTFKIIIHYWVGQQFESRHMGGTKNKMLQQAQVRRAKCDRWPEQCRSWD